MLTPTQIATPIVNTQLWAPSPGLLIEVVKPRHGSNSKHVAMWRRPAEARAGGKGGMVEGFSFGGHVDPDEEQTPWFILIRCPHHTLLVAGM